MASRRRTLFLLVLLFAAAGAAWAAWWHTVGRFYESTDNAYVAGNLVEVTPQVAGTVIAIGADDTDRVQAGQMLVQLDPADAQVALDQAEAELARAVREVRTLYANNLALDGQARMLSTIDLFWLSGVLFLALAALVWLANAPRAAAKMAATPGSHE